MNVATETNRVLVTVRLPYELLDALSSSAKRPAPAPKSAPGTPRP